MGPSASFSRMILPHWLAVLPHPTCTIQDCAQTGFCKDEMVRLIHSELLAWCLGKQLRSCSSAGGSSHLAQEAAPVHVSLCPTIRGQQWTCAQQFLISLQHVSEESSPLEYKGCHMNHFVQHVLSMHVFGVVSDIKQDSWNSHVYSEICERLCPQQS